MCVCVCVCTGIGRRKQRVKTRIHHLRRELTSIRKTNPLGKTLQSYLIFVFRPSIRTLVQLEETLVHLFSPPTSLPTLATKSHKESSVGMK